MSHQEVKRILLELAPAQLSVMRAKFGGKPRQLAADKPPAQKCVGL
jgi:hypothetical protein